MVVSTRTVKKGGEVVQPPRPCDTSSLKGAHPAWPGSRGADPRGPRPSSPPPVQANISQRSETFAHATPNCNTCQTNTQMFFLQGGSRPPLFLSTRSAPCPDPSGPSG